MAAVIDRQHQELAELKEALSKIIQALPHGTMATAPPFSPAPVTAAPLPSASASGPWSPDWKFIMLSPKHFKAS